MARLLNRVIFIANPGFVLSVQNMLREATVLEDQNVTSKQGKTPASPIAVSELI